MVAASIDRMRTVRIRIRGADGVGKTAFDAPASAMQFPAGIGRDDPTVSPLPANIEEKR
jgi:hypothetical protein